MRHFCNFPLKLYQSSCAVGRKRISLISTSSGCEIASPSTDDNLDMNGFQEVVWEIVSNTGQPYTFKNPDGIFFKDAEAQGLIPCHPEGSLGTRFRCHSKTKNGEAYKYSIQLNGTPPLTVDPWIVNR